MPFLTLKKVIADDGWSRCPEVKCFLVLDHALECMHKNIEELKSAGVIFDENSSPHLWLGTRANGLPVSVQLIDEPFADNCQLYAPELTILCR